MSFKKIMISQPMSDLTEKQILQVRDKAKEKVVEMGYFPIDTWFGFNPQVNFECNVPLYLLGRSIQFMAECDAVYFCKGWEEKRGCRIEHEVAKEYGLELLYEE